MNALVDLDFCKQLPKVELHAHLGGSLSGDTLKRLLFQKSENVRDADQVTINKGELRTMADCFKMFQLLHELVTDAETVKGITKDVITDFANDGVRYLELRSTPRDLNTTGLTKRSYIQSVLNGIAEYEYENSSNDNHIDVRYLPSIDRACPALDAFETVKLAEEFAVSTSKILGIDFSGNPYRGEAKHFVGPLLKAKQSGLKLSIHASEITGRLKDDRKLLDLPLDRIGHGTFIQDDPKLFEEILQRKIPLELCITSNIKTQTSPADPKLHHLTMWRNSTNNHPCVVCTDDKGIFATSLSREYKLASDALGYSRSQMFELALEGIDYAFVDLAVKNELRKDFLNKKAQNGW